MKKKSAQPAQIDLFAPSTQTIALPIDVNHPMVRLKIALDWDALLEIATRYREMRITSPAGAKPHLRANLGAVVVRSMKSCDLRTAADLVENYLPARYLCDLHESRWTPDFRTLFDFEVMLGDAGLSEINSIVLHAARERGFARLGQATRGLSRKVVRTIKKIKLKIRSHRLFAKTKESRIKTAKALSVLSKRLLTDLANALDQAKRESRENWDGQKTKAFNRLIELESVMRKLLPQIDHWIRTGFVAKDKIVSLFAPEVWAILRGKVAKEVEFGLKWGINQVRGGYISLFEMPGKQADVEYALESIIHHQELFGESPKEFGFDRAAWSQKHIEQIRSEGVIRIGIAPKGQADWLVSTACRERIQSERAQVEGKIGTLKMYGFNKPNARSAASMRRSARRAEIRFNMTRLLKDLALHSESTSLTIE